MKLLIFALIPLILSIGLVSVLSPVDALQASDAETQCREGQVLVFRTIANNYVCVSPETADKWVGWGIAERVEQEEETTMEETTMEETTMEETTMEETMMEETMMEKDDSMMEKTIVEIDYEAELLLVPQVDGGTTALTVTPIIGTPDTLPPATYVVGTEELREDEMRITFCGTGMPYPVYQQASACVIVELGNGDVFLFDLGAGSISRINGMQIDIDKLNKIFLGHLHLDHVGDVGILWAQGGFAGRSVPLEIYGPSGPNHELGTEVFIENTLAAGQWDLESRKVGIPTVGMAINTHEFDWDKTQVIYEENDVTITSFPAIHILDGAVSFRLDWNGLSMTFSSDTEPNKFLVENSIDRLLVYFLQKLLFLIHG